MEIIIGIISGLFWPALFIAGIVWFIRRVSAPPSTNYVVKSSIDPNVITTSLDESAVRAKIAAEIRAQSNQYTSLAQKKVVEDMAQTVEYFAQHGYEVAIESMPESVNYEEMPVSVAASVAAPTEDPRIISMEEYETPWKKLQVLDGATILLYLGAFFLLASIGLYVGFGAGTTLKALLVLVLTGGFYAAGLYLHQYTQRLKPVGGTFAAIGMATLPMAGAAIYYFALDKSNGPVVWLATSLLGIGLYAHAMYVFRSTLVSYMIVFSTLSMVLASISTLGLAPYYFIQGIGFAGVSFVILAKLLGKQTGLVSEAYERSASFMVPFSVALSVLFIVRVGWLQLAASLLLGAAYYIYLALEDSPYRQLYVLLGQVLGIFALLSAVYGIAESALHIAIASSSTALVYGAAWLLVYAKKPPEDLYRQQVMYIYLVLPLLALVALLGSPASIWWAIVSILLISLSVYVYERDVLTGSIFSTALLALPLIVSYLSLDAPLSDLTIVGIYLGMGLASTCLRGAASSSFGPVDTSLQQYIFIVSLSVVTIYLFGERSLLQFAVICGLLLVFMLQSLVEQAKAVWVSSATLLNICFVVFLVDSPRLLFSFVALHIGFNLALVLTKKLGAIHSWIAVTGLLVAPLLFGETIALPGWSERSYLVAYSVLFVVLFGLRVVNRLVEPFALSYGYLIALAALMTAGLADLSSIGLVVTVVGIIALYLAERVEGSDSLGYLAPYLGIAYVFADSPTKLSNLLLLGAITLIAFTVMTIRRRLYESYVASITLVASVWYGVSEFTSLSASQKMYLFFGLTAAAILLRLLAKVRNYFASDAAMVLYALFIGVAVLYMFMSGWFAVAAGLFMLGIAMTAISYLEKQPTLIIAALLLGFASILRFAIGNDLGVTATTALMVGVAHISYWLLVVSGLTTIRAGYARSTLITVAATIPMVGLAYSSNSMFPLSLALFGGMLLKEVWSKGQSARELAILCIHSALLWWLYVLGVRELQVFTQLSALVLGGFAYARRYLKDSPSTINQYLWASVLTFTLPMVWQALTSTNPNYSYLLLFEHILLIVVSILYRRSTFAWWGIVVVVAAVLYQLRKLRYAALAFLGVFIISLAVYFLLRYNKPDTDKK